MARLLLKVGFNMPGGRPMRRSNSKIYALVLALVTLVVVSLAPRQAKACGSGGGAYGALLVAGVVGAGLVVTDVVFTGYDLVQGVSEARASKGMAIAGIICGAIGTIGAVIHYMKL